jgi:hypothetical protein
MLMVRTERSAGKPPITFTCISDETVNPGWAAMFFFFRQCVHSSQVDTITSKTVKFIELVAFAHLVYESVLLVLRRLRIN